MALHAGCGRDADVGSDVLWSSRFEGGNFGEWASVAGGTAEALTSNDSVAVTTEHAHGGSYAAKLTIDTGAAGVQQNTLLSRAGDLPAEAYYSAWYYLPRSATVNAFWVIFKFRQRAVADDAGTTAELFDLDLLNLDSGHMRLEFYDHRVESFVPLDVADIVVPVGAWFQIEAFYRNAHDSTGHLTYWLNGRPIIDLAGQPMAATAWVEWDACSIGEDLDPPAEVLFIDDCAVSRSRVGPTGIIAR